MFPYDAAQDYKRLDIQAGDLASIIYAVPDTADDKSERQKIRKSLLDYCKLVTLAMVMSWQEFNNIAETSKLSP